MGRLRERQVQGMMRVVRQQPEEVKERLNETRRMERVFFRRFSRDWREENIRELFGDKPLWNFRWEEKMR